MTNVNARSIQPSKETQRRLKLIQQTAAELKKEGVIYDFHYYYTLLDENKQPIKLVDVDGYDFDIREPKIINAKMGLSTKKDILDLVIFWGNDVIENAKYFSIGDGPKELHCVSFLK